MWFPAHRKRTSAPPPPLIFSPFAVSYLSDTTNWFYLISNMKFLCAVDKSFYLLFFCCFFLKKQQERKRESGQTSSSQFVSPLRPLTIASIYENVQLLGLFSPLKPWKSISRTTAPHYISSLPLPLHALRLSDFSPCLVDFHLHSLHLAKICFFFFLNSNFFAFLAWCLSPSGVIEGNITL